MNKVGTRRCRMAIRQLVDSSEIDKICQLVIDEGLAKTVWYDEPVFDLLFFRQFIEDCKGFIYVVDCDGEVGGIVFMSHFEHQRFCRVHFCGFAAGRWFAVEGARMVVDWLVPQYFDVIVMWLPTRNRLARKIMTLSNCYIVGEIPNGCVVAGKSEAVTVGYYGGGGG